MAATSVLAASLQLQEVTAVSEIPANTDDDCASCSAATAPSVSRSSSASYTSKNTAAKELTKSPLRITTARAVKFEGGAPIMLTETVPVDVACSETICNSERYRQINKH